MKFLKLTRNNFALLFLAVLAVSGVAFLVWAAGANVNCIGTTCNSTTGQTDSTPPFDATTDLDLGTPGNQTLFTNDNDTASIECPTSGTNLTYSGGGGNDTFYLRDPAGTPFAVTINGEDGDDVILDSCTSNNTLNGGNGNDFIVGGSGNTTLNGGNGNDLLAGGQGTDTFNTAANDGDDVFIGGPGTDTYSTTAGDGNDIVIIYAGDVPAGNNSEQYTCRGNDTILMFGFNTDLVLQLTNNTTDQLFGFGAGVVTTAECDPSTQGDVCFADPRNNSAGAGDGARYRFSVQAAGNTCTIIVAE